MGSGYFYHQGRGAGIAAGGAVLIGAHSELYRVAEADLF